MNADDRLLVQAALDGELDAPTTAAFERRLAAEPDLADAYAELRALHMRLRGLPAPRAPDALRAQIAAMAAVSSASTRPNVPWRAIAASVAMLGIGLLAGWNAAPRQADVEREILAGHLRGMMSSRPVDVVSSDQHTVKPWFAGRLSVAPTVPDLSAQGYALEGGRIDVVEGEASATLVYRIGKHLVSVTRLPSVAGGALIHSADQEIDGYTLVRWRRNGVTYVATSDAGRDPLLAFKGIFEAGLDSGK